MHTVKFLALQLGVSESKFVIDRDSCSDFVGNALQYCCTNKCIRATKSHSKANSKYYLSHRDMQ